MDKYYEVEAAYQPSDYKHWTDEELNSILDTISLEVDEC